MTLPKASKTLKELRQAVGLVELAVIVSTTSSAGGDKLSLIDTYGLAVGGTDDYKGRQVQMISGTTNNIGDKSFVTAYDGTSDCTIAPAVTDNIASGDGYEMWKVGYRIENVDNFINQAIVSATDDVLIDKEDHSLVKEVNKYQYTVPTGFVAIHTLEYVYDTKIDHSIEDCDTAWSELTDGDVTVTADTTIEKQGSACLKLEVADACAANDILATEDITSLDISDCDEVIAWIQSTTALDAGDIQILLDDTASCASAVESLDVTAVTANTWTRVTISLANPQSDSAIISVGIKMITDKGAFTLWVDDIRAQNSKSRIYRRLNPNLWRIISGTTNYIKLNEDGYATIANNKLIRLLGYRIPAELSADTSTSEVDPDYVVAKTLGILLGTRKGEEDRANFWMTIAEKRLLQAKTSLAPNTRWV